MVTSDELAASRCHRYDVIDVPLTERDDELELAVNKDGAAHSPAWGHQRARVPPGIAGLTLQIDGAELA